MRKVEGRQEEKDGREKRKKERLNEKNLKNIKFNGKRWKLSYFGVK